MVFKMKIYICFLCCFEMFLFSYFSAHGSDRNDHPLHSLRATKRRPSWWHLCHEARYESRWRWTPRGRRGRRISQCYPTSLTGPTSVSSTCQRSCRSATKRNGMRFFLIFFVKFIFTKIFVKLISRKNAIYLWTDQTMVHIG